jgi:MerC mercury resistance protein
MKVSHWLDRIGSAGALLAAIAAPCCFPLFAAIGTVAGLSALGEYEGLILYIFQLFALLTLAGLVLSFRKHGSAGPGLAWFHRLPCARLSLLLAILRRGALQRPLRSDRRECVELLGAAAIAKSGPTVDNYLP